MVRGRRLVWGCCALLACVALGQGQKCNSTQYEQDGRCCSKCPPGHQVRTACAGQAETVCEQCEPHHFQGDWTQERHCTPHSDCDENAGLVVRTAGSATQNVACQCQNGTHCSSHECQTCRVNKRCGLGEGVQQEASGSNDTVCVACPPGSFSSSLSATARCQPWSSCEAQQLVQRANGTRSSDVVCADLPTVSEDPRRSYSLPVVLGSLAAVGVLGVAAVLFLRRQNHGELQNCPWNQEHQQPNQGPGEYLFEDDVCPALPVQETLPGGKPLAQEEGKDSRLAEQEGL